MRTRLSLITALAAALFCHLPAAQAGLLFQVTVDTSSIAGATGSLDFNFNPGFFGAQPASLDIVLFGGNGTLTGSPAVTGNVSGALPGTVTFDNGTAFNDYFTGFTYGTSLWFMVTLYGPAVDSPDNVSISGSTFSFSMFSDAAGTIPTLTSDKLNGFASTINVDLGGAVSTANYSSQTTVAEAPEPASLVTLSFGLAGFFLAMRRKQAAAARS